MKDFDIQYPLFADNVFAKCKKNNSKPQTTIESSTNYYKEPNFMFCALTKKIDG